MASARLLALLLLLVGVPAAATESVGAWGSLEGGLVPPLFLGARARGGLRGLQRPQPDAEAGETLLENLAPGSQGGSGPGWFPRANVRPSLLLFPPPLASAPPRAPGSDVTKPVSPLLSPTLSPSPGDLGALDPPARPP